MSAIQTFDVQSEKCLKTLTKTAEVQMRLLLFAVRKAGINARVISGTRTYDEQNALFAQGRTKPGNIVTNARAGYSNHNFGLAVDLGVFDSDGDYLEESPLYAKSGAIGEAMGLTWGGSWKSIQDEPHFECKTGKTLAELRAIVSAHGGLEGAKPAIDALILALKALPILPATIAPPTPAKWQLLCNGISLQNTMEPDNLLWTPARAFVRALHGEAMANLLYAPGKPFETLALPAYQVHVRCKLIGDYAHSPVREIASAFGGVVDDSQSAQKIITVTKSEP